jgi:hypothetical protein
MSYTLNSLRKAAWKRCRGLDQEVSAPADLRILESAIGKNIQPFHEPLLWKWKDNFGTVGRIPPSHFLPRLTAGEAQTVGKMFEKSKLFTK